MTQTDAVEVGQVWEVINWHYHRDTPSAMNGRRFEVLNIYTDPHLVQIRFLDGGQVTTSWSKNNTILERCKLIGKIGNDGVSVILYPPSTQKMIDDDYQDLHGIKVGQIYHVDKFGSYTNHELIGERIQILKHTSKKDQPAVDVRYLDKKRCNGTWYVTTVQKNCSLIDDEVKVMQKSDKNFEIITTTYIRGQDAEQMSDDDIMSVLNDVQAELDMRAKYVTNKSNNKRMSQLREDMQAIIEYLDARVDDD